MKDLEIFMRMYMSDLDSTTTQVINDVLKEGDINKYAELWQQKQK
jgi:hypothetical protein|nr:MAG TPA: hypothetical protein [Caudoviricetes sp.]